MNLSAKHDSTIFGQRDRWAIRVLAWLAFIIASYLTWHAATGSQVVGCSVGSEAGCDLVLNSAWSKWLSVPVSFFGLACYASLATFAALIGWTGPREGRWIDTLVVMLATMAAGAGIWFIALQIFAIGHFCPYCIVVDLCGIALGGLALWAVFRQRLAKDQLAPLAAKPVALRTTRPNTVRSVPLLVERKLARPPFGLALGGSAALLALLIGGQIFWPARTYVVENVALDDPINMTGLTSAEGPAATDISPTADEHVALRPTGPNLPHETDVTDEAQDIQASDDDREDAAAAGEALKSGSPANEPDQPAAAAAGPKRSRELKFLGGKLTLDTYQHPILGDPEAPHVIVEMIAYDCPHCRKMHETMQRGLRRYGKQLAVLVLIVPLEMKCNHLIRDPKASHPGACKTAQMALAVAQAKPSAFRAFHDWLMADKDKPPSQIKAVERAYATIDSNALRKITSGDTFDKQIAQNLNLFSNLQRSYGPHQKNFGFPIQILGDKVMAGSVEKSDEVYKAWEENLGIKPL